MRFIKRILLSALVLAGMAGRVWADQVFDFSFTNTIGNVAGTVTGEVVLPFNGNGTAAASDVLIESFPTALSSIGIPPVDASGWTYQELNSFTVSSGQVTEASEFYAYTSTSYPSSVIDLTTTTSYLAYGPGPLSHGSNLEVFSDATLFNSAPAPSPEPTTATLFAAGLMACGTLRLLSQRETQPAELAESVEPLRQIGRKSRH